MKFILLALLFPLCLATQTTRDPARNLTGKVTDSEGQALAYVNAILLDGDDIVKAEVTDESGSFRLTADSADYILQLRFLGYETLSREIAAGREDVDLPTLALAPASANLREVTVTATKPLVTVDPDKTVFNVADNLAAAGNTGFELLRMAPGVVIDNSGNLVVEGKTGVRIYINGRESYLSGDDLRNYLQSLPADNIESIEIITQPSARFSAEGNAGIINIKLRRAEGQGTRVLASSTVTRGVRWRTNSGLNVNHRNQVLDVFANYSNYIGRSTGFIDLYRLQGDRIFDAQTDGEYESNNHNLRAGLDFRPNDTHTFGFLFTGFTNRSDSRSDSRTPILDRGTETVDSILLAPNRNDSESDQLTFNFNYAFEGSDDLTLNIDLDYGRYRSDRFGFQPNFYVTPNGATLRQNIASQQSPTTIDIYTAKLDHERPVGDGRLAAGAKFSQVITDNRFRFFDENGPSPELDPNRSNDFNYDEAVFAGYLNYKSSTGNFKYQAGLRLEHTRSVGDLNARNGQGDQRIRRDYTNLFPSAGLTWDLAPKHTLALLYSRRIRRPSYRALNPFEYQLDELSFRRGNPFLQPQYTDNVKLNHTFRYTLNTSLSYSTTTDFFAQITEAVGGDRNFLTTRNVATQQTVNLSISYPFSVTDWWRVYANVYGYRTSFTASDPAFVPVTRTTYGGYGQNTFSLPAEFKLEVSGWFQSPGIWGGTYRTRSMGSLNLGLQREVGSWTFRLSANDVLFTSPWRGTTQFGELFIDGTGGSDSRTVSFYVSKSFGQSDVKRRRNRKAGLKGEADRI